MCELTPTEETAEYLQQNPAAESALWSEWVQVVCGWEKIAAPSPAEWEALRANFYSGKMPIESVDELKALRLKQKEMLTKDMKTEQAQPKTIREALESNGSKPIDKSGLVLERLQNAA
jgi:hypothetical protein